MSIAKNIDAVRNFPSRPFLCFLFCKCMGWRLGLMNTMSLLKSPVGLSVTGTTSLCQCHMHLFEIQLKCGPHECFYFVFCFFTLEHVTIQCCHQVTRFLGPHSTLIIMSTLGQACHTPCFLSQNFLRLHLTVSCAGNCIAPWSKNVKQLCGLHFCDSS